jgi:predicted permease
MDIGHETRNAVRRLLRAPSFTVSAVLLLGLGVGSVTTIFTLVDHILLRPLPYPEADRLVAVENGNHSGPDWRRFHSMASVETWAAVSNADVNLTGEGSPLRLAGARVTERYFSLLGAGAAIGRLLVEEDFPAAEAVVLSHGLWQRAFGGDAGVVGRTIRIDEAPALVVGVAEESFVPPAGTRWGVPDLWRPENFADPRLAEEGWHALVVFGRLTPGATVADAAAEARALAEARARELPDRYVQQDGTVQALPVTRLRDATVSAVRDGLGLLMGAVTLLLLVACANVAHLFMARGIARTREMAVRRALGAGSGALSRQLACESLLIALAGAAVGAALAGFGLELFLALSPEALPRAGDVGIDPRVLGFAVLVATLTTLAFGMVPALRLARGAAGEALRAGAPGAGAERRTRALRGGLVIAEVALSLVLVTQAALLLESFVRLRQQPLGFQTEGVWTLPLRLGAAAGDDQSGAEKIRRFEGIRRELAATPGVRAATFAVTVPLEFTGGHSCCWSAEGGPPGSALDLSVDMHPVGPQYADVFAPRLLAGRWWSEDEALDGIPPVVINASLAATAFGSPDESVGQEMVLYGRTHRVTGVAAPDRHYGPDREARTSAYLPMEAVPLLPFDGTHVAVLVDAGLAPDLPQRLREAVWRAEPAVPVPTVRSMASWTELATAPTRFDSALFSAFGAVALLLAAGGLYGTMLYTVGTRRRELGIRMALGARPARIEAGVLGHGLRLAAVGVILGAVGAWAASRLLETRLFQVEPGDPGTFAVAITVLLGTAALASWLPARRAAGTDPLETLREG